jgi:hypothetical protein
MKSENESKIKRAEVAEHVNTSINSIEKVQYLNNAITLIRGLDDRDAHHIGAEYIDDLLHSERTDLLDKVSHSLSDKISPALGDKITLNYIDEEMPC